MDITNSPEAPELLSERGLEDKADQFTAQLSRFLVSFKSQIQEEIRQRKLNSSAHMRMREARGKPVDSFAGLPDSVEGLCTDACYITRDLIKENIDRLPSIDGVGISMRMGDLELMGLPREFDLGYHYVGIIRAIFKRGFLKKKEETERFIVFDFAQAQIPGKANTGVLIFSTSTLEEVADFVRREYSLPNNKLKPLIPLKNKVHKKEKFPIELTRTPRFCLEHSGIPFSSWREVDPSKITNLKKWHDGSI